MNTPPVLFHVKCCVSLPGGGRGGGEGGAKFQENVSAEGFACNTCALQQVPRFFGRLANYSTMEVG